MSPLFRIDPSALVAVGGALAFLALPGWLLVRALGLRAGASSAERVALAWSLSLAVQLLPAYAIERAGGSFRFALAWAIVAGAVSALWILVRSWPALRSGLRTFRRPTGDELAAWVLALALFAFGLATSRPFAATSDVPDHLATIRAIGTTNVLEPTDVFHAEGDGVCRDPRKGFLHVWMACVGSLSKTDPITTWVALRPWLLLLGGLAFAGLGRRLTIGRFAFRAALACFPLLVHGSSAWFLDTFSYPHNADWVVIWGVWSLAAASLEAPSRGRMVAIALLGGALPLVHVFAGALALAGLLTWPVFLFLFRERGAARGALAPLCALAIASLPVFVARLVQTYCPVNPLHTEAAEVFYLTDFFTLHAPGPMLARFSGAALVLALVSIVWARPRRRGDIRTAIVAAMTWGPPLVSLNPIAGALLQPKIGYLFVRFLGIIPYPIVAALLIDAVRRHARRPALRAAGFALLAALVLSRVPPLVRVAAFADDDDLEGIDEAPALLAAHVPDPRATILTDPTTSYLLPAFTSHRVVTTLDQHSAPGDAEIRERLRDVTRALSPFRPLSEAVEVCRTRNVRFVLVNESTTLPRDTYFDARVPADDALVRARFEGPGSPFRKVGEGRGLHLYELTEDVISHDAPRRYPTSREGTGLDSLRGEWLSPAFSLVAWSIEPRRVAPGDTITVSLTVRKDAADGVAVPYRVVVRGRHSLEGEHERFRGFDRLYARVRGRTFGPTLELVSVRRPLDGRYPPNLWDVGEIIEDRFPLVVPKAAEAGAYRVGVAWSRAALVRNIALRDLLRPTGGIGVPLAEIEVVAR